MNSDGADPLAAHAQQPVRPVLEARGLSVRFGGLQALNDVTFDARRGEVLGVIGPNGAGKTTLFNVVCGFVAADSGQLRWEGKALPRVRPDRLAHLGIARTLQGLGVFAHLSVLENVTAGAHRHHRTGVWTGLFGLPGSDRDEAALRARAMDELTALGIDDLAHRLPGTLPYGLQKRVALARALVSEPRLLLLDEPASGLSEAETDELAHLIRELRGRMTVMLVEHHMDLVMAICDRIVVLDFGQVIATGTPGEIQGDQAVLDAYLGQPVPAEPGAAS